ncbi:MAG: hypothetical protein WA154_12860 [Moraxellaceae bacterium]
MKNSHKLFGPLSALFASIAIIALAGSPAGAQTRVSNVRHFPAAEATAGQTFATTSYADLVNAAVTFVPVRDNTAVEAPGGVYATDRLFVQFNADVSKATGTTGECAIYANGAVVAASSRFSHFSAGRNSMTSMAWVIPATGASQVVKVQCRSADTSIFTVTNATLVVQEVY